ncbi:MAG: family 43 glycosylhydrolase [Phycisphaera sp.]|nr:family 43 glycosylhydrolase [Phycisphaera sp.]
MPAGADKKGLKLVILTNIDGELRPSVLKADDLVRIREVSPADAPRYTSFHPGQVWYDDLGKPINAHGGGILFHDGTYYWFGEHKTGGWQGNATEVGVHVYSSADLYNWTDRSIALAVSGEPNSPIAPGCTIERPKVIYNTRTQTFVMWFHHELKGQGYHAALCGVATSNTPQGPYTYLKSFRPDDSESRDMNLFVDDDATAYLVYSSEGNATLHISQLSEDYLSTIGKFIQLYPNNWREAPALFKREGKYYLITSGCTGWDPNAAKSAVADNIMGPWIKLDNPCVGTNPTNRLGPDKTFGGQSTCVFPIQGKKDRLIAMFDIWNPKNPIDGQYLWLPVSFTESSFQVTWRDEWTY